jgi:hypothetical protein
MSGVKNAAIQPLSSPTPFRSDRQEELMARSIVIESKNHPPIQQCPKNNVDKIRFFCHDNRSEQKTLIACGCSSVVERNLAKVDVARSNRVSRLNLDRFNLYSIILILIRWGFSRLKHQASILFVKLITTSSIANLVLFIHDT